MGWAIKELAWEDTESRASPRTVRLGEMASRAGDRMGGNGNDWGASMDRRGGDEEERAREDDGGKAGASLISGKTRGAAKE